MSQFININDRLMDYRATHRQVLKGSLSHISFNGTRSSSVIKGAENQNYYRQKISLRIKDEQKHASIAHLLSLQNNYQRLKHNLHAYARSKSLKLQEVFENGNVEFCGKETQKQQKGISRTNTRQKEEDRVVFIDRKYNRQLAIKAAAVSEIEEIRKKKEQMRRAISCYQISPLADQANRELQSNDITNKPINKQNPVISRAIKSKLHKRHKDFNFNFRPSTKPKIHDPFLASKELLINIS